MKFRPGDEVKREPQPYDDKARQGIVERYYRSKERGARGIRIRLTDGGDFFADDFKLVKKVRLSDKGE